jgi:hypothetical protein
MARPYHERVSQITSVTAATRTALPPPCISCVFWQHDRLVSDERHKAAWAEGFGRRHGAFGRVLRDGPSFRGMVQFGPAEAFPRALALPAGPPSRDAALITCTFLEGDDPEGSCERLLLEALADLKAREMEAVEAFALAYPDDATLAERFLGHHTLFDRGFLEGLGFTEVRRRGDVALMRIDLGGLVRGPGLVSQAIRLVRGASEPGLRGAPA